MSQNIIDPNANVVVWYRFEGDSWRAWHPEGRLETPFDVATLKPVPDCVEQA